jgi:hypothetical protein
MRGNRVYLARRDITIMTGITVVDAAGIVRPAAASEGCGGMTGRTVQVGRNMAGTASVMPFAVVPSWHEAQLLVMPV